MIDQYFKDRDERMKSFRDDPEVKKGVSAFMDTVHRTNYVKNWSWMGVPILQLPTDMFAIQELIWKIKPSAIIETGVAFGGSILFYASILESMEAQVCPMREVIGIDIEIRKETDGLISSLMSHRVELIQGSSTDMGTAKVLCDKLNYLQPERVMVVLDSNHIHDHVFTELKFYSQIVSIGSYIIVMDTSIEWLDPKYIGDRPWGRGNSPWSAVQEFMQNNDEFVVDTDIEDRILLTSAVGGWLRRVK